MAKKQISTAQPKPVDGRDPVREYGPGGYVNVLNQDHIDRDPLLLYLERAPYSKTSKASEVFGPRNHEKINMLITQYTKSYDVALEKGDKQSAGYFENGIKKINKQLQNLSNLKDEWMMMRGGGTRGKSTVSNITDPRWPDLFFTEKGDIHIAPDFEVLTHVPSLEGPPKKIEEIPLDWESKGDGEGRFMSAIEDMQEAAARGAENPPFDVDYFVSNLLDEYWPQALADKWGGIYALHDILPKMVEANGGTVEGLSLSPESFNPKNDIKLHKYYTERLRRAFNPNYLSDEDRKEADALIASRKQS